MIRDQNLLEEWVSTLFRDRQKDMLAALRYKLYCEGFDPSVAEDILQDVFTELHRRANELHSHANIGGWLWNAAQNYYRNERRKRLARLAYEQPTVEEIPFESDFFQNITFDIIRKELNPSQRQLFDRYFVEGDSIEELMKTYGVSYGTLHVRLTRLRQRLAMLLEN